MAQDVLPKAAPQDHPVLLSGATLHTVSDGVVEDGFLLFDGGKIQQVSAQDVSPPASTEVVDGTGLHVYPGFVLATSVLGLAEVGSVDMTLDKREAGDFTPEVRASIALNPDSWVIPVTRRNGVLTAGVVPSGGRICGRAAVIQLDGWTSEDLALVPDAGLVVQWPTVGPASGSRRRRGPSEDGSAAKEAIRELDQFFDAAEAYVDARRVDPSVATDLRFEALAPVLEGAQSVWISATSKTQIESAVRWAVERNLDLKIVGGRDAALCADLLSRHEVPIAITSAHRLPHRRDLSYASTYELPGLLEEAEVPWCLTMSYWSSSNARNLPYEAAACIAYGLPAEVALRSITLSAAEFLGVEDRLGSLEAGKDATLFLADGDPFEMTTRIVAAYIGGRRIVLEDKQTQLYDKYREKYRQLGLLPGGQDSSD